MKKVFTLVLAAMLAVSMVGCSSSTSTSSASSSSESQFLSSEASSLPESSAPASSSAVSTATASKTTASKSTASKATVSKAATSKAPATQAPAAQSNTSVAPAPAAQTPSTQKSHPAGMYKIGTDLPAGEYILIADGYGYFQIAKDSTGNFDSLVVNDNFNGRSIVTVTAGQYFTVTRATIYKVADAPAINTSSGTLSDGMYRVGIDIKSGEYKLRSTNGMGYNEIAKDSTHNFSSLISNDNFNGDKYLTIKDGQYLKLARAEIILK